MAAHYPESRSSWQIESLKPGVVQNFGVQDIRVLVSEARWGPVWIAFILDTLRPAASGSCFENGYNDIKSAPRPLLVLPETSPHMDPASRGPVATFLPLPGCPRTPEPPESSPGPGCVQTTAAGGTLPGPEAHLARFQTEARGCLLCLLFILLGYFLFF